MSFSLIPISLEINPVCKYKISSPVNPVPAINIMNATSGDFTATIGAIMPPSL